jgi:hypothetical protein
MALSGKGAGPPETLSYAVVKLLKVGTLPQGNESLEPVFNLGQVLFLEKGLNIYPGLPGTVPKLSQFGEQGGFIPGDLMGTGPFSMGVYQLDEWQGCVPGRRLRQMEAGEERAHVLMPSDLPNQVPGEAVTRKGASLYGRQGGLWSQVQLRLRVGVFHEGQEE